MRLAAAGTDTTAQLIANAVVFLSDHPGQLAEAIEDPSLWERVIEETLRRRGSATFVQRSPNVDVEIAGVTIPADEVVWLSLASASNDPAHYDEPERWDIHREKPDDHLAFGKGRHFCLGAPIGRAEARIGLRVLFERLPDLRTVTPLPLDFAPIAILRCARRCRCAGGRVDQAAPAARSRGDGRYPRCRSRNLRPGELAVAHRWSAKAGRVEALARRAAAPLAVHDGHLVVVSSDTRASMRRSSAVGCSGPPGPEPGPGRGRELALEVLHAAGVEAAVGQRRGVVELTSSW